METQGPKYQKVIDWVKSNIENGTLKAGDRLMSEMEMSEFFGLSRQTIRHATGELVNRGILNRVKGSGTYIGEGAFVPGSPEGSESGEQPSGGAFRRPDVKRKKTMNIAVVSTFYESYIFPDTLKGIERVLSKNGYSMQVSFTDNRMYREKAILKTILEKDNVDGLIVEPAKSALPNLNVGYYRELMKRNIPVLFFNACYPDLAAPCVRIDDTGIAYKATKILLEAGHRKIGGLFKADDRQGALRFEGYLKAMYDAGCRAGQKEVLWLDTLETISLGDIGDYIFTRLEGCTAVL